MWDESTGVAAGVGIASGAELTRALFVRDRFALRSALSIPALHPPVTVHPVDDVPEDAWDRWWAALLDRHPSSWAVPGDARLAELADAVDEDARRWEDEHVSSEPPYGGRWISTWLVDHRLLAPVEVLLVGAGGVWHEEARPGRFLVSVGFFRAHDLMDAMLRRALESRA